MEQTEKYQLSQWEQSDRIQMEDFNSDNAKVEEALAALAGAVDRLNSRFYTGAFSGNGDYTSNRTYTFPRRPLFIMFSGGSESLLALPASGHTFIQVYNSNSVASTTCSLSGNTFSWQNSRCNRSGVVYKVFAILEA